MKSLKLIIIVFLLVLVVLISSSSFIVAIENGKEPTPEEPKKTIKTEYTYNTEKDNYYNELDEIKSEIYKNGSVRLSKWNEEVFIDLNLPTTLLTASNIASFDNQTFQLTSNTIDIKYYLKNVSENIKGFEYEIILKQKPLTNLISVPIETENLDFYYQRPLYETKGLSKPNATCNATDCEGSNRPLDVVGSYAVYHSSKKNNKYKVGKAFHIYRPLIIDNNNNTIYADLNISNNQMKITIDSKWLDTAKYPVIIDPTLGYTTAGSAWLTICVIACCPTYTSNIYGANHTMSEDGTATAINAYLKKSEADDSPPALLGIYNQSGAPSHPLSVETSVVISSTTGSWVADLVTMNFDSDSNYIPTATCRSNTGDDGDTSMTGYLAYDDVSAISHAVVETMYNINSLQNPWTDSVDSGAEYYSIFANYTAAAPEDTCSCPVSGNWNINCADDCYITDDCNMKGNTVTASGAGTVTVNALIYNFDKFVVHNPTCKLACHKTAGCFG